MYGRLHFHNAITEVLARKPLGAREAHLAVANSSKRSWSARITITPMVASALGCAPNIPTMKWINGKNKTGFRKHFFIGAARSYA
jgi:hypothetical protein